MLFLGVDLQIFRSIYLNSVPSNVLPSDAAAALFDTFVRFIKDALRGLLVIGLVVAAAAFFTGPSTTAVRTRSAFASGLGWIRHFGERRGRPPAQRACGPSRTAKASALGRWHLPP